jgi:hypothetical protein
MKTLLLSLFACVLLTSFTATGQINPVDRPLWSQGFFLDFEETGDAILDIREFEETGIHIFEIVPNPAPNPLPTSYPGSIYGSATVGQITTTASTWEGIYISNEFVIDCSLRALFQVDVLPPASDHTVALKFEDSKNSTINKQVLATTTAANEWQTLTFDFTGTESGKYDRIVLLLDFESTKAGDVWYFDNIRQTQPEIVYKDGIIDNFETKNGLFWGDWGTPQFQVVENPDTTGGNYSQYVGYFITTNSAWEGASTAEPIAAFDFSEGAVFRMKVYAPEPDRQVLLKLENLYDKANSPMEISATTTTSYEWEELVFDFNDMPQASDPDFSSGFYQRIAVFPDFGAANVGEEWYIDDIFFEGMPTSVHHSNPDEYQLAAQNYPNPFNPGTTITFTLPKDSKVKLMVYNSLGEQVAILVDEYKAAGSCSIDFNGSALPSGVYFYRLATDTQVVTNKMLLIK